MKHSLTALLICCAAAAQAQSVDSGRPQSVTTALLDLGYRAELTTDSVGDPLIRSATNGASFSIFFYGCSDEGLDCKDLQFSAGFDKSEPMDLSIANEWNNNKVTGRVSLDDEGDPYFQMLVPGALDLSRRSFERVMARWDDGLGEFLEHIDW